MSDKSVVDQIKHYQRDIVKCPENAKRMIRCIERLMVLPVTIAHLQETGVGRSVNELRKCGGEVGAAANSLVCKWKSMVQADEDSDVESEVEEDEPKEPLLVSSPDIRASPSTKNESVDKYKNDSVDKYKKKHDSEEYRKPKSDHSSKKSESSHSENRLKSSDKKSLDKYDHKSHRNKTSKSEHGSGSDSKHSSSHRSKSDHDSRSKSHSSHRSDSEYNGDIKTERPSSKTRHDENKTKSSSSESKIKDVKQKRDKDKHRREERSHRSEKENRKREESSHRSVSSSSSKKYDVRRFESESSDDDKVYKPRSKKRKKSESEEDRKSEIRSQRKSESEEDEKYHTDKYSGQSKRRESIKHESSEESDTRNASEEDENSRPSSRHSETRNESDNEEEISNRSSPNNMSDNEAESDSRRSSSRNDENEDSHSVKASDSDENDDSPEREIYVPTKIKREKESPPKHSKTSSDKNKSSHSRSHSNYSSSHNSSSRSKNDKVSNNKKEGFENLKIKKEKDEIEDSRKRRDEKSSDKKSHKSSNSHSDSGIKESNKTDKKVKIKIEKQDDGSIDCGSGASFADALMGLSEPKKKSAKRKSTPTTPEKPSKSAEKTAEVKPKTLIKTEPRISSSTSSSSKTGFKEPDLLSKNIKLEPLDVDLKSTLPEISPHYKPLPHYSPPGSPPGKRSKLISQEEALCTIMTTKNQRTKVYSGNKTGYLKVPSLFDLCIQVLRDNIEALEYTGGVPYDLLKPVLDRATAAQLFQLEHYNPYLVEDTDVLWKFHCNKDFRGKERDEFESWRELYVRLLDERERKLEALKANITQSMAKNTPVRQTKLAYVDSVVKPPRNVAKKQMKFGTGKAVKHELVSKAMVGAASGSPATPAVPVPAPPASARTGHSNPNAFPIPNFLKKKKAPLMQKTLQLIKGNRFKR